MRFLCVILLIFSLADCSVFAQSTTATSRIPTPRFGSIRHIDSFPSKYVQARPVDVWLPDGYDSSMNASSMNASSMNAPCKRYPVLYMHDGQMLFDSAITWNKQEWCADETASRLQREGKIRECIIVGVWNNGRMRAFEYFPEKPFRSLPQPIQDSLLNASPTKNIHSDAYLKFLTQEVKTFVDSSFATLPDVKNTFVAGSSMGGLISMYAISEYPSVFGGAACISTHWVGSRNLAHSEACSRAFQRYMVKKFPTPKQGGIARTIYFDYGTATLDSLYKPHQIKVDKILRKKGYTPKEWQTREFLGEDHSERAWSKRFEIPLLFLLGNSSSEKAR